MYNGKAGDRVSAGDPGQPAKVERDALLRRLRAAREARRGVAIVGVDCRVPGATNYGQLWPLLAGGIDAITEVPKDRWDVDASYDPNYETRGTTATRWGGFIENIDRFDASFFGVTPREAVVMDPQHRLLLACAWHALEDAGLRREALAGTRTGVYVAQYQRDYAHLALADPHAIDAYTASGTHHGIAANRLSYWLDLRGPSLVVDTACSSSLVALHLAMRALRRREIDHAIVAGVNLMISPEETIALSRWGVMAADGRCKTFDHRADGFVRGEGVVAVVLTRSEDAQAAGLRVRAELLGSAVNQDGRSNGLTAPNGLAQQAVVREALRDAKIEPEAVTMIEAHGTGTALGDPIEVEALAAVYGAGTRPCTLTSVKSKIGHLEAAAGLAGLLEALACIEHGEIAASLHIERLNPALELEGTRLRVARERREWLGRRIAGVSAFGMGGTNAHVILAAPAPESTAESAAPSPAIAEPRSALLVLSAENFEGLVAVVDAWIEWLRARPGTEAAGPIADAAIRQRSSLRERMFVIGRDCAELLAELERWRAEPEPSPPRARRGPVLLAPGQGGQWLGMGRSLYASEPVFRAALDECAAIVEGHGGPALVAELHADAPRLGAIEVVQPMLFGLALGYAALWRSVGLEPSAVVGHSMGEAAAAAICGALSIEDAAWIIVERSRKMARLRGRGAMLVVERDAGTLEHELGLEDGLELAAVNGPTRTVASGSLAGIEALERRCAAAEVETRRIDVEVASHHAGMDGLRDELLASFARLEPKVSTWPMISTVGGQALRGDELDAGYWFRNLRQPVLLWPVIEDLLDAGVRDFIELGPHPVLLPAIREGLLARGIEDGATLPSSRRPSELGGEREAWLRALGQLWVRGQGVDLAAGLAPASAQARIELPRYPFVERRYWLPPRADRGRGRAIELAEDLDAWFHRFAWRALEPTEGPTEGPARVDAEALAVLGRGPLSRALASTLGDPTALPLVATVSELEAACEDTGLTQILVILPELGRSLAEAGSASPAIASVALELGAVLRLAEDRGLSLWLVTCGGGPELGGREPLAAAHFGLARVASVEHEHACEAIVDLDPGQTPAELALALADTLTTRSPLEPVLALREGRVLGLRLQAAPLEPAALAPLDSGSTYLVVGGLGGLGQALSGWLIERGARHLLILGRRSLPKREDWSASEDPRVRTIQTLERAGAAVHYRALDIGEGGALEVLVESWERELRPPIRGVIHAAGVQAHVAMTELERSGVVAELAAKVEGSEACARLGGLDFLVLCSSAATMLRSPLLATYVAGCAYQDALAERAREHGAPVSALGWGVWAKGITARFRAATGRSVPGFGAMDSDSALAAVERVLAAGVAHRGVMKVDWARWAADHEREAATPAMVELVERGRGPRSRRGFDREILAGIGDEERRAELVRDQLLACLTSIARLDPGQLDPSRSAASHGLDSLMAVELRNRLRAELGVSLAIAKILRSPSLDELAATVANALGRSLAPTPAADSGEWETFTL